LRQEEQERRVRRRLILAASVLAMSGARAQTIIDEWTQVNVPPPPQLQAVTVDPKTDALLVLDFNGHEAADSGPCNKTSKPRCLASLPKLRAVLDKAREKGVFVVYSLGGNGTPADIWPEVAPKAGEPIVKSGPDKFIGTELRALLEGKGVSRVIVTGTASEGAVLNTAADAAFHGMSVVLPVDGMSSTELYAEQYVAWHMTHAPGVAQKTTLTSPAQLQF
jgi:nicotinamidase-related amidase